MPSNTSAPHTHLRVTARQEAGAGELQVGTPAAAALHQAVQLGGLQAVRFQQGGVGALLLHQQAVHV